MQQCIVQTCRFVEISICTLLCVVVVSLVVACESGSSSKKESRKPTALQRDQITRMDRWAVESPMQASVEAAVIRQCTLYEYHFGEGISRLTPIGQRDLKILAGHYGGDEWVLSVRQGSAEDGLYEKRVAMVKKQLGPLGVHAHQVTIVDAMPGGAGLAATDARRIRKDSLKGAKSLDAGSGGQNNEVIVRPLDSTLEGGS